MNFLILTSVCLFALSIFGYLKDNEMLTDISITSLIILGIFGWGMWASLHESSYREEKAIVTEIIKGKHIVVVSTVCLECDKSDKNYNTVIFKDNEIDVFNNTTYFYWKKAYNIYGYRIGEYLKFR